MKKNIILIILFVYVALIFAEDKEDIFTFKPHYQSYNDSVWFPNTTVKDFVSIGNYHDNIYIALNGGIGRYHQDSLLVYPYPFLSKYKSPVKSVTQINNELFVTVQNESIEIFDLNLNLFVSELQIEDELNFNNPYSSLMMKYDKDYNTIWISTINGLYMFDLNTDELINWTQKYKELINNDKIYSDTPIIIDKENIWIISNIGSGSLLSYNKSDGKWTLFRDELIISDNAERIYMSVAIKTPQFFWISVRGNKKFGHIAEYDKKNKTWTLYEYLELTGMIDRLINEFPNLEIFSHTSRSFPKGNLENYKKIYQNTITYPDNYKEFEEYYKGYDENVIDNMLEKLNSIKNIEILSSEFIKYDNKIDFTYKNQLVFHDDNGYISTKQNYLDEIIEYYYPITQYKKEVILLTNKGLSVLNLGNYSISNIEGTSEIGFAKGETNTLYIKIKNHIYLIFLTYGHDREYFIYDYDMDNHIFKEITPDFEFSFKQKYFWEFDSKLFMLRRHDLKVFKFQNDTWIEVKEKNEPAKLIQPLSKELILNDGRKLLIDFSGLIIFN